MERLKDQTDGVGIKMTRKETIIKLNEVCRRNELCSPTGFVEALEAMGLIELEEDKPEPKTYSVFEDKNGHQYKIYDKYICDGEE